MSSLANIPRQLSSQFSRLRELARRPPSNTTPFQGNHNTLPNRLVDVFLRTWDLGFTAFGGPPVHFQILHQRFVDGKGGKQKWVDEETVRAIPFSCQARAKSFWSASGLTSDSSTRNCLQYVRLYLDLGARR